MLSGPCPRQLPCLASTGAVPCSRALPSIYGYEKFSNLTISGRTDFRISSSGAKFDEEVDFDVRSAVGPPKPHQIDAKLILLIRTFRRKSFFGVEKSKVANLPKRALPKFRADRSQVRGVNQRSKFAVAAVCRKLEPVAF